MKNFNNNNNEKENKDKADENQNNTNELKEKEDKEDDKTETPTKNENNNPNNNLNNSNNNIYHRRFSIDNIFVKIKYSFWNRFVFDIIEKNLINKNIRFKKFSLRFPLILRRKEQERMLKMKISDIIYEQNTSSFNGLPKYENRKIIDKIYKEKKEINVIKILELTYEELFIIFRRKLNDPEDIEKLKEIKDKIKGLDLLENNNYNDIEYLIKREREKVNKYTHKIDNSGLNEYIEKIKKFCLEYEKFIKGRAKRQRNHHH